MIVASWRDVATRCFTAPNVPISSREHSVITYSQMANFWQFMMATSFPEDPNREWHAQELRNARINLARALKEWETDKEYGCWD